MLVRNALPHTPPAAAPCGAKRSPRHSGCWFCCSFYDAILTPNFLTLTCGDRALSVVNGGLFVLAFRALTAGNVSVRDVLLPGAVLAAVAWQVLQWVGCGYVGYQLQGSSQVYGLFGIVLGLFAWIYLEVVIIVLAAELNVVLPRAAMAARAARPLRRRRRPHPRRRSYESDASI